MLSNFPSEKEQIELFIINSYYLMKKSTLHLKNID